MKTPRAATPRRRPGVPALAVVIPVLNEPVELPRLLSELAAQDRAPEIVVADGGSRPLPSLPPGVALVRSAAGRGRQMNAGAAASRAQRLLFLHADSRLPGPGFLRAAVADHVRACAARGDDRIAGHFALRFERRRPGHDALFRYLEAKTRSGRRGSINGDQGMLLTRRFFDELGGFDCSLPIFEDQRLAARVLDAGGAWRRLPGELGTSARRFEDEGHWRCYALMGLMTALHAQGRADFLRDAAALYPPPGRARRLRLAPLLDRARSLLLHEALDSPRRLVEWGRYLRANAWQLGLALDLALDGATADGRWQARIERWAGPERQRDAADIALALSAAVLLLGVAPLAERLADRFTASAPP